MHTHISAPKESDPKYSVLHRVGSGSGKPTARIAAFKIEIPRLAGTGSPGKIWFRHGGTR